MPLVTLSDLQEVFKEFLDGRPSSELAERMWEIILSLQKRVDSIDFERKCEGKCRFSVCVCEKNRETMTAFTILSAFLLKMARFFENEETDRDRLLSLYTEAVRYFVEFEYAFNRHLEAIQGVVQSLAVSEPVQRSKQERKVAGRRSAVSNSSSKRDGSNSAEAVTDSPVRTFLHALLS